MHCSLRLTVQTLVFSRSYLHRQVSPPETLVVKGREMAGNFDRKLRLPRIHFRVLLHARKYATWNKRLYFLSEGRHAEDIFALKIPTASPVFEPANLGTKGQHAI